MLNSRLLVLVGVLAVPSSALAGDGSILAALASDSVPQELKDAIAAQNRVVESAVGIFVGGNPVAAAGLLATVYNQTDLVAQFQGFPTARSFPELLNIFGAIVTQFNATSFVINPTPSTLRLLSVKPAHGRVIVEVEELGANLITIGQPIPGQYLTVWRFELRVVGGRLQIGTPTVVRDTFSFIVPLN